MTSTFVKEMQILSEILLQYIYYRNPFYVLYCHVSGDAPRITCHFTVVDEFKTLVINCHDDKAVFVSG